MYKNITYLNNMKSTKKYEKALVNSKIFDGLVKTKDKKNEISYISPDVLISISKYTVNFLVFDYKNYQMINKINDFLENKR